MATVVIQQHSDPRHVLGRESGASGQDVSNSKWLVNVPFHRIPVVASAQQFERPDGQNDADNSVAVSGSRFPLATTVSDQAFMPGVNIEQPAKGEFPREMNPGGVNVRSAMRQVLIPRCVEIRKMLPDGLVEIQDRGRRTSQSGLRSESSGFDDLFEVEGV